MVAVASSDALVGNRAMRIEGATVWEGVVHVFDLEGHPKATRAYAWSSPIEGSTKRRFFAVLGIPPIMSPLDAVRAAIVQESRAPKGPSEKKLNLMNRL